MTKRLIRVSRMVAAAVSVIFVPKVAVDATLVTFFNNPHVRPTVAQLCAFALAAVMLLNVIFLQDKVQRGNRLTLILLVYQGIWIIKAFDTASTLGVASPFLCAGVSFVLMLGNRLCFRPEKVSWARIVIRLDLVWLAAVVFLFAESAWVKGVGLSWVGVLLTVGSVVLPFSAGRIWPGFSSSVEGGKSLVGTARWILGFAAAGNFIAWTADTQNSDVLAYVLLMLSCYGFTCWQERPATTLWTTEILGVMGSGVATTLHLILSNSRFVDQLLLVLYGGLCLIITISIVLKRVPS